jgi:hypothetical protein
MILHLKGCKRGLNMNKSTVCSAAAAAAAGLIAAVSARNSMRAAASN